MPRVCRAASAIRHVGCCDSATCPRQGWSRGFFWGRPSPKMQKIFKRGTQTFGRKGGTHTCYTSKVVTPQNKISLRRRLTVPNGTTRQRGSSSYARAPFAPAPSCSARSAPRSFIGTPLIFTFLDSKGGTGGLIDAIPRFIQKSYTDFALAG